jgi:hypothetical protein
MEERNPDSYNELKSETTDHGLVAGNLNTGGEYWGMNPHQF